MAEKSVTKLEAARQQLEKAIQLYLEESHFLSAITLAGAAEEVLGKMRRQDPPSLSAVEAYADAFRHFESDPPAPRKEMIGRLNEVRDWLKHFQDGSDLVVDEREAAFMMINRAVVNYMIAARGPTGLMREFIRHGDSEA